MNWLLIIVAVILVWRIAEGVRRGMVKEIISFVSLIVLCLVVVFWELPSASIWKKIL